MGKQTLPETANATATMIPEAARRLMERYRKEHERINLEFKRGFEKLTPEQSLPPDDPRGIAGEDSSTGTSSSEDSSSSHETDGADNSSEDEDSKIPLPPPADPDKPATTTALAKRAKPRVRANEASKLNAKKSKAKSKKEQGKENNKNVDKKQETNGINPSSYAGFMRFLPPGSIIGMKPDGTVVNGEGTDGEKKERTRASKIEFKRLDEL